MKKEKILINIEKLEDIEKYEKIGINNFLFAVKDFSIGYNSFTLDEIIYVNNSGVKVLYLNKILNCKDIESLKLKKDKFKAFKYII